MKRARLTMAKMMAIVVIVAFNIVALQALFSFKVELVLGLTPIAIVLQVSLLKAIRHSGRARSFWLGFSIFGSIAAASFVWATFFDKSWLGVGWSTYGLRTNAYLRHYAPGLGLNLYSPNKLIVIATMAILCFVPQMVAASIGGLLGFLIANRRSSDVQGVGVAPSDPATGHGQSV